MITREESQKILADVRANIARLESCDRPHRFKPHSYYSDKMILVRDYKCEKCGGIEAASEARAYMQGLGDGIRVASQENAGETARS